MRRVLARRASGERGAAALLVAVLTVVFTGVLAFVTDFGMAYTNLRVLQNGADAGALAAAREIALNGQRGQPCILTRIAWTGPARDIAERYFAANGPTGDAAVDDVDVQCRGSGLAVEVATQQNSPVFFGKIVGATGLPVGQPATTLVAPAGAVVGVRPYAICDDDALRIAQIRNISHNVLVDADFGTCGTASGNWGWLDLDGAANGSNDVDDWVRNGYSKSVGTSRSSCVTESPDCLESSPGVRDSLSDGVETLLGRAVLFPVFDDVVGATGAGANGANARFHVTGFLSAQICAVKLKPNGPVRSDLGRTATPCYDGTDVPTQRFVQLRFHTLIPVGELSGTAGCLGDPTCDYGVWVAKLVE